MIALVWAAAQGAITFETPTVVGAEVIVAVSEDGVPGRGETVRVVHRPGTAHERERAIGITDGRGRVAWTPEEGGVAEVRAGDEIVAIRVAYRTVPTSTLATLLVLGLASLGLALTGLRRRTRNRVGRKR